MDKTIEIYLNNKKDYTNNFNKNKISPELFQYIIDEVKTINNKDKINLDIYTKNFILNDKEKEDLAMMIKSTFEDDVNDLIYLDNNLIYKELLFLLIGVFIIAIYFIFKDSPVISEIILIIGWLMIWESVGRLVFSRTETKIKIKRRKQVIKSKINFID